MATKQCGTCEFWDRENIRLIDSNKEAHRISDCRSDDNSADCFDEIIIGGVLEKYPMIEQDGQDCVVYKKIKEE